MENEVTAIREFERTLTGAMTPGWYGSVSAEVKNGKIIRIKRTEETIPQEVQNAKPGDRKPRRNPW